MNAFTYGVFVMIPLLGGVMVHGLCIKFGWLKRLAIPVDAGATFRGTRVFGDNKTYRGFVAVGLGTGLANTILPLILNVDALPYPLWLLHPSWQGFAFGVFMGVCAMAFELPNSFVKRQLGISPGKHTSGAKGVLFYVIDQIDIL